MSLPSPSAAGATAEPVGRVEFGMGSSSSTMPSDDSCPAALADMADVDPTVIHSSGTGYCETDGCR